MQNLSKHLWCHANLMTNVFKELALRVLGTVWWGPRRPARFLARTSSWMKKSSCQAISWTRSKSCTMLATTFVLLLKLHLVIALSPNYPEPLPRTVWKCTRFHRSRIWWLKGMIHPNAARLHRICGLRVKKKSRHRLTRLATWRGCGPTSLPWALPGLRRPWHLQQPQRVCLLTVLSTWWYQWTSCSSTGKGLRNFAKVCPSCHWAPWQDRESGVGSTVRQQGRHPWSYHPPSLPGERCTLACTTPYGSPIVYSAVSFYGIYGTSGTFTSSSVRR